MSKPGERLRKRAVGTGLVVVAVLGYGWWLSRNDDTTPETGLVSGFPRAGYDRAAFGPSWTDTDRNGCNQRDDVLRRDLTITHIDADGCTVKWGVLEDDLTGKTIQFTRGVDTSRDVQIDHRLSLGQAWRMGASEWTNDDRLQFANDLSNLEAMDGPSNGAKSDKSPSEWMPPNEASRCAWSRAWEATAVKYKLNVSEPDQLVIDNACEGN